MARVPSFDFLTASIERIARRFPLVLAVVALVAIALQVLIDEPRDLAIRVLVAGSFAVPALIATALTREMRPGRTGWLLDAAVLVVAIGFAWIWPSWTDEIAFRRLAQANLAGLLAAAALPFVGGGRAEFWPFNRSLFVRFVVASIFAVVLFVGLGLAIAAVEKLFGLSIDDEVYPRLMAVLATVFHPLYVLGGIPDPLRSLADDRDFPRPLRVFAQFILLPLVSLYLLILLAYLGRVVLTQEWPEGWIGWLVSAVAVAGLLAVLLLDPVAREERGSWVGVAARVYFAAMLPALVMLLMALGKRVGQYGITENRYFLGALAVWMLVLCATRTARLWKDPRWIPATLALVVIVTSVGPWSAYAVSRRSQSDRLEELLAAVGRLENGVAVRDSTAFEMEDAEALQSTIRYLVDTHGRSSIDPWFEALAEEIDPPTDSTVPPSRRVGGYLVARRAIEALGLWSDLATDGGKLAFFDVPYVRRVDEEAVTLGDVEYGLQLRFLGAEERRAASVDGEAVFDLVHDAAGFVALAASDTLFRVDLRPAIDGVRNAQRLGEPVPVVRVDFEGENWRGRFVAESFVAHRTENGDQIRSLGGWLFFSRR